MQKLRISFFILFFVSNISCKPQSNDIIVGAEQFDKYVPIINCKKVAIVTNHSSIVNQNHLVDTLLTLGIKIKKIFSPEHGFRGEIEAGELINNYKDSKTGLQVISLYGNHKKPLPQDLQEIDIVVFDMQDVGVRFYTYISTMHYVMEACAESDLPLIILDRPNPNGFYVDGPVLDTNYSSFVGLHPVPIVHGMTIAEYAQMINGEKWLKGGIECKLIIIPCINYDHNKTYILPVRPSPNLPNQTSILLYPSLGLFEGTSISIGRGTDFPFQVYGHPSFVQSRFTFTPIEKPGASKNPPYKNQKCNGIDLRKIDVDYFFNHKAINLDWLITSYELFLDKKNFFNAYFKNLAGTNELQQQIENGIHADSIRKTWKPQIYNFMLIRKKYLLYPDFILENGEQRGME